MSIKLYRHVLIILFNHHQQQVSDLKQMIKHATTGDHVIAITADFQACIGDGTVSQIV